MTIETELEVEIEDEVDTRQDMTLKDFEGGLYAVLHCEVSSGEEISACWQQLVAWLTDSEYDHAHHQWLEEHLWTEEEPFSEDPLVLDLYAPIRRS
jgi:DNA gyrase inhibitor GyrI